MLLVLVITHALASVLVIHGKHPNLVNCRSLLDEVVLDKLSDGIYVACTLDTSFVYYVDDECEVVSRTPDDLNHVLCKLQVEFSINLPHCPGRKPNASLHAHRGQSSSMTGVSHPYYFQLLKILATITLHAQYVWLLPI